jgi:hypothetical protein
MIVCRESPSFEVEFMILRMNAPFQVFSIVITAQRGRRKLF